MNEISVMLLDTDHRPYELPNNKWTYYQEWNKALFLHWSVPYDVLRRLVPERLNIDTFGGRAYVSLVAFTMEKIRPRYLPSVSFISDFGEINVRTYIDNDDKKGVYFLNIEAEKALSSYIARHLSGLPYEKANIKKSLTHFQSKNSKKGFQLHAEFEIRNHINAKSELDKWLTERYCLYLDEGKKIYRYDIHHKEWDLKNVEVQKLNLDYKLKDLYLQNAPELQHYSDGVKVVAWNRTKI